MGQLLFPKRSEALFCIGGLDFGTHLGQFWFPSWVVVHVHQVRLGPERSQAGALERDPPVVEEPKIFIVVPRMQLDLQLPNRESRARKRAVWLVRRQECGQRVKLGALNIDLEHVDEFVAWISPREISTVRGDEGTGRQAYRSAS